MSARECPANDWPLVTVNTPTTAEVIAMTAPTSSAVCTGSLLKKPGPKISCIGYHQHPVADPDDLDRLTVQPGENVGLDYLVGGTGGDLAAGHVDDAVHHRQQRVHVVGGQQDGDLLALAELG